MKKKLTVRLVLMFMLTALIVFASLYEFGYSVNSTKDLQKQESLSQASGFEARRGEYTVRLIPQLQNTFGFDIRKGNTVIYLQQTNPFFQTPEGFINPNDALNVAWWVVEKIKSSGQPPEQNDFNSGLEQELNLQHAYNF